MPKIYRSMKCGDDNKPIVEQSNKGLGVRSALQDLTSESRNDIDICHDNEGNVHPKQGGMSVSPRLADLPNFRLPPHLRAVGYPDARGPKDARVFSTGTGPFQDEPVAARLHLTVDSAKHGCVEPAERMPLSDYCEALAKTRSEWAIDEAP